MSKTLFNQILSGDQSIPAVIDDSGLYIYLFDKDEQFVGIRSDAISFVVEEGEWTLNAEFPNDQDEIAFVNGMLLGFTDIDGDFVLYEIKRTTIREPEHTCTIYAEHAAMCELLDEVVLDEYVINATAGYAVTQVLQNSRYTLESDTSSGTASITLYYKSKWECLKSIVEKWHCAVKFRYVFSGMTVTHRYIRVLEREGADRGKRFELWKDIENIGVTYDDTNIVTAAYGRGKGEVVGEDDDGNPTYGRRLTFSDVVWSTANGDPANKPLGQEYIENLGATEEYGRCGRKRERVFIVESCTDPELLLQKTWEYLQANCEPIFEANLTVQELESIYGFEHEAVRAGDGVLVIADEAGVQLSARVNSISRDYLSIERSTVHFGNYHGSSVDLQTQMMEATRRAVASATIGADTVLTNKSLVDGIIDTMKTLILSSGTNFYTDEADGSFIWENDASTRAVKITGNGIMIASSKIGAEWQFTTAMTGEGIVANAITSGALQTTLIRILGSNLFYWDAANIHIIDPDNSDNEIRIGAYDGVHYGIAFSDDGGETWKGAITFDGIVYQNGSITVNALASNVGDSLNLSSNDSVQITVQNSVNSIEIGGRNIVLDSKPEATSNAYTFAQRNTSEGLRYGKTYTFSANGRTNNGATDGRHLRCYVYNTAWTFSKFVEIPETADTTATVTFTAPFNIAIADLIVKSYYYPQVEGQTPTGNATINWYKLEKGSKATDWTPAPEDPVAGVQNNAVIVDNQGVRIESGGYFILHAGEEEGQHIGISTVGDNSIFIGADNAQGDNAKFTLSKYGEAQMRDAQVSGEIEVNGSMEFGEDVSVTFRDDAARFNFLRAMAGSNVLPYNMGGTNADSREIAMRNLSLRIGTDVPSNQLSTKLFGDRYLRIATGSNISNNTVTLTRNGYYRTKTSKQRRLKTDEHYALVSGGGTYLPANNTTYSSWSDTETPTYGEITNNTFPGCYESSGTASGQYNGSPTTEIDYGQKENTIWKRTTTRTYQYRTYTRTVYFASFPAPTSGSGSNSIKSGTVKTANLSITTNATSSTTYTLYLASSSDGQTSKTLIGTNSGTTLTFSLLDVVKEMHSSTKYLILERSASSSAEVRVTAATLALQYFSGARIAEEYVWNGNEWMPLSWGNEFIFNETSGTTYSAGEVIFDVPLTGGNNARYGFELRGKASNEATELMLAMNGDYTEGNYQATYCYGSTTQSRPIVLMANNLTSYARGELCNIEDSVLITGTGQRGYSARDTAVFSIVKATNSLSSIQVRCRSGQINAGVIFRVWRIR